MSPAGRVRHRGMTATDLGPAAERLARIVENIPDDALKDPTPCSEYAVGDLLDHVGGACLAFRAAAEKQPLAGAASGDATNLAPDWKTRIPADARALAEAWRNPDAWTGMTAAGGVDLPGDIAGRIALDELVVHGWDLAKATGQPAAYDGPDVDAVLEQVLQVRAMGLEGIFGPELPVPENASTFDRVLRLTGRDPNWKAQ